MRVIGYKKYVTCAGDTFDALALSAYNDEKMAGQIIRFNPDFADVIVFGGGVTIRIPVFAEEDMRSETLPPWRRV